MEVIIVDDENLALKNAVKEFTKALEMAGSATLGISEEEIQMAKIHPFRLSSEVLDFIKEDGNVCDIALLDIEMPEMTGVELAKEIKRYNPRANIIFTTAHPNYMDAAFGLHASGYCLKPVTSEKLVDELENLRHTIRPVDMVEVKTGDGPHLTVKTFGNFEAYVDGTPIRFKYSKSKELLAYLIDRNGSMCSNRELMAILWEDDIEEHFSYLKKVRSELITRMKEVGCEDALNQQWGSLGVVPEKITCDYFDWLKGDVAAINAYRGEYMTQYEWGEFTHGLMEN